MVVKKILMEISISDEDKLEWKFSSDLNRFNMYAIYGLLDLIREELKADLMDEFEENG